jgi:Uma2 family endonuclease
MRDSARRLMTVEEFLDWDDGTDTRYELVDGVPVAMAPPLSPHTTIVVNASFEVTLRLQGREPCHAEAEAGIRINRHRRWQADLAVTCAPPGVYGNAEDPVLIVEVLSRSTRNTDLKRKLPDYKALPTVQEIWLIDSERRWVQVWRREGEAWAEPQDLVGPAAFDSPVLRDRIALDRLYRNTLL